MELFLVALSALLAAVTAREEQVCFKGLASSYIQYSFGDKPLSSTKDKITLTFRSSDASGLLLYGNSRGLYGDHIFIELLKGKLRIRYQLGQNSTLKEDIIGDNLGDDIQSTVTVSRNKRKLKVAAYGGQSDEREINIPGADDRLDLNAYIYLGGYPGAKLVYPSQHPVFFKGCMTKAVFNDIDLLKENKNTTSNDIQRTSSPDIPSRPMNFKKETFMIIPIQIGDTSDTTKFVETFYGSFSFRTTIVGGTVLSASTVSIAFQESQLQLRSGSFDVVEMQFPNNGFASDGRWYKVEYYVKNDLMRLKLNDETREIKPSNPPQFGTKIIFGRFNEKFRFVGCIRDLNVQGNPISYPTIIDPYGSRKIAEKYEHLSDGCKASDPCVPNPCFHEAECFSRASGIECECKKKYKTPYCQFSQYPTTCSEYLKRQGAGGVDSKHWIDPDNSGPEPPIEVQCNFKTRPTVGQTEINTIGAENVVIDTTQAGRYSERFSYKKEIEYEIPLSAVKAIVDRSQTCEQLVKYECRDAKLFDAPGGSPMSRWLSGNGYLQYYWGGAQHDSYKCACAYTKDGCQDQKRFCNCDSADTDTRHDEGVLNVTRDLPVREVQFGGLISTSQAVYTIREIICYGVDALGAVTFIAPDGWLRLPAWDSPLGGDIAFYIKTVFPTGALIDHRNSEENHIFQVSIHDETTIVVTFSFGTSRRTKYFAKMADGLGKLSDNNWHKIHVIRTLYHISVQIDEQPTTIPNDDEKRTSMALTGDGRSRLDIDLPMFVGAFWRYPTYKNGYVGCMKGFTINGVLHDLVNAVDHLAHEPESLVLKGCGNACNYNQCPYGKCVEKYTSYGCDCTDTPFYGEFCNQEIGADIGSSAIHTPEENVTTGQSRAERIALAFATGPGSCQGTLFEMLSRDERQYYKLELIGRDEMKFKFKLLSNLERVNEITIKPDHVDFCDTARHIIFIERNATSFVKYKVDGRPLVERKYDDARESFNKPYYFYVGDIKNAVSSTTLFVGCISGAKFHLTLNTGVVTVEPIRQGVLSNDTGSDIKQKSCGATINTPRPMSTRKVPGPTTPTDYPSTEFLRDVGIHEAEDSNWAVLIVVALLMMLLLVALVVLIIWFVMQHKNDYQILEKEDGTVVGTATVRGGNASLASVPAGTGYVAAARSQASQASQGNLSRAKSKSNDVFV